jgi:hypothetical protein
MRLVGNRSTVLACLVACAAMAAAPLGCLPTRGEVSPDGRTFYFSMMVPNERQGDLHSAIVALDADTGRLAALTNGAGTSCWCSLSPGGEALVYMGPALGAISFIELEHGTSVPIAGAMDNYSFPRLIPGKGDENRLGVLALTQGNAPRWVVMTSGGTVPLPDLAAYDATPGEAVVLSGGVLGVAVHRLTNAADVEKGKPKQYESSVIRLSVGEQLKPFMTGQAESPGPEQKPAAPPAPPKGTVVATWTSEGDAAPTIDLAVTGEGSKAERLVAAVSGQGPGKDITQFFEILAPEKGEPRTKLLFEAAKAGRPEWTPDGQAIVYMRTNATNSAWIDVVLWRPDQKEPLVLAHLPGKASEQDDTTTAWRWLANGRLRIFNVSGDGLRQIDTAADGTGAKGRRLRPDRLNLQLYLALADRAKHEAASCKMLVDVSDENAKLAPIVEAIAAAAKALDEAREKLWPQATEWEDVPALPEVPPPPPTEPATAPSPDSATPSATPSPAAKPAASAAAPTASHK